MKIIIGFFITLITMSAAMAQPTMIMAIGGKTGTYWAMFEQMQQICGESIPITAMETSGSTQNVDLLTSNKVNGAMVQSDVLWVRSKTENLSNVKTLLALHPEEVHLIAMTQSKKTAGGFAGFGAKPIEFTDLESLAGQNVAAAGGSFITAQALKLLSDVNYNIVEAPTNDAAMDMLRSGQVEAVIGVGGSPLGWVNGLSKEFKLLYISESSAEKLKVLYSPANLNYSSMSNSMGVKTVSTDALLVTREYKSARYVSGLRKLRTCVSDNLDELKETTGYHPKWQTVDSNNHGKLPYYEIPAQ